MVPVAEVCSPDITPESFLEIIWNLHYHQVSSEKSEQNKDQWIKILMWKGSIIKQIWISSSIHYLLIFNNLIVACN